MLREKNPTRLDSAHLRCCDKLSAISVTVGHERALPIWLLDQLSRPRDVPVTNVVAMLPILGACYLTRSAEEVSGSGQ